MREKKRRDSGNSWIRGLTDFEIGKITYFLKKKDMVFMAKLFYTPNNFGGQPKLGSLFRLIKMNSRDKRYRCLVLFVLFIVAWGGMSPGIAAAWNGAGPDFRSLRGEFGVEDEDEVKVEKPKELVKPSLPEKREERKIIKVVPAANLSAIREDARKESGDLPESPYKTSDDLVNTICRDIKKKAGNKGTIYIDTTALVYDKKNNQNEVIRLSGFLASKLRRYFHNNGLKNATIEDDADYFLGIRFHPHPNQEENLFQFVVELTSTETGESEDAFYYIESAKLPGDYLEENMKSKMFKVASEIADGQNKMKLWIEPFVEANSGRGSAFSRAFARGVENQIVNLQRGITVLVKPASENGYVLKGQYVRRNGSVDVTVRLVGPKGMVLKSVALSIAESIIQDSLDLQ